MHDSYIYYPEELLEGHLLDVFLSKGWYRMGQGIFTTHYLVQQEAIYPVYWLRYDLEKLQMGRAAQKILRMNQHFSVSVKPLEITEELEALYSSYKEGLSFDPALSVRHWLYGDQPNNVFHTDIIEIREDNKLLAAGIFDKGLESIAGIMNFYSHEYKRYSPGKFLMLLKILHAAEAGKKWYYPGYIVYGYPKFDYKLFADKGAAEIYVTAANEWCPYKEGLLDQLEEQAAEDI